MKNAAFTQNMYNRIISFKVHIILKATSYDGIIENN